MQEMKVMLKGLSCANCAGKIEKVLSEIEKTEEVSINLMKQELTMKYQDGLSEEALQKTIADTVHRFEPHVDVLFQEKEEACDGGGCCCTSCGCHDHHDYEQDDEEVFGKAFFLRFGLGLVLFIGAVFWQESLLKTGLFLMAYLVFGYDVLLRAVKNITRGQVFDENFLMSVSTVGALALGEMAEAVFVMLFYQVGEAFQDHAVARSRKSITALLDIRPDFARLLKNGETKEISPEQVSVGDYILVKAGERIPLDGIVEEGSAMLDTAALTGESLPRKAEVGDLVLSGCINMDGNLKIRVEKPFGESTVVKILEMVENAAGKKSRTEKFITRFARVYTPVVCLLAVLVATIPVLLGLGSFSVWFGRALVFLVVSCPCALVLSVPLSYFAGIGAASSRGILVKGGEDLDTLCNIEQVVFDKTGTLTKGKFSVAEVNGDVLKLAAIGEAQSNHPIAKAIVEAYEGEIPAAEKYQELGGYGISYMLNGETVLLGNSRLMEREHISYELAEGIGTVVYVAKNGVFLGHILVADTLKENIRESLAQLKQQGVKKMVMLTGDRKETAEAVAKELGLDAVYSELLPQDKVEWVEKLKSDTYRTAFVGDGINDAPVLAGADIGIAMGGIGSDAAIEAADVVLMDDDIGKLATGIRIAKNTRKIVNQNIVFALGCKILVLLLS
ncbi:MAG: cadmium-translocating P-type ATPase, partial [Anaerotignum sp.]|nr:cadmium-translocating P-type ATPase [Anaerotignum sp.]